MTTTSLSSKLTPSSKRVPCGACGDTTGKCRATEHYVDREYDRGSTVGWTPAMLCMVIDAAKGETVGDYVCTGETSDGLWRRFLYLTPELHKLRESWADRDSYQPSDEEIAQREERHRQREEQRQKEAAEREARALSAEERHKWHLQILSELHTGDDLLKDLDKRKLTDEEKFACELRSVKRYQKLVSPVDPRLPGSSDDGTYLIISGDGFLCPYRDYDGLIVGCQIRLSNPPDKNRYRHLSTDSQTRQLYPERENPLAVFKPVGEPIGIALAEGTGIKPYLASRRRQEIVIGAPGNQFPSSPNLCESYLNRAHAEVGGEKIVTLYPDAGDVSDRQTAHRWKRTCELLTNLGWKFRFSWWGQIQKIDSDIDELDPEQLSQIKYIPGSEFFSIAELGVKNAQAKKEAEQKILEKEREFERLSAIRNKLIRITEIPYKVVNVRTLEGVLPALIEPGTANIINSATATGKSRGSRPIIDDANACSSWHNRLALTESTATDFGIAFKDAKSGNLSKVKKVAACSPSMISYNPQHLRDKGVVFMDECDQVADFSFSSICNRDGARPLILTALENQIKCALSGSGNLLALSADIGQKEIDYFRALTPDGIPFRYIVNEYKPKRGIIHLDNSGSPEGLIDELMQRLKDGKPCFVLDDLKNGVKGCKSIAQYVRQSIPEIADKIIEIHADSADDPRVKAFRNSADEESKKYLCVICSPSIVSGISIVNQVFVDGVFVFAQGILTDRSIKQFINRIRGAKNIFMWVCEEGFPPQGISKDLFTPEEIKDYYRRNYEANARHIMTLRADYEPMRDEWYSPHFELYCKNLAYHACTMKHLRRFTVEHLQQEGYKIVDTQFIPEGGIQEIEDALKLTWGNIELTEALAIASARLLSDTEMEMLSHADYIPPELLAAYRKTQLHKTFGERLIESTSFEHKSTGQKLTGYAAMALKNHGGDYARHLENYYLLSQDVSESIARDYAAEARQLKYGDRFPSDIRWNTRKRKGREWLGLKDFLTIGVWWEPKDFKHVSEKAKSKPNEVKDTFNYTVSDVHDNQLFDELIRRLGLKLKTKSVKGEKWKLRAIDEESWNHAQMYVEYKLSQKESVPEEELSPTVAVDEVADFAHLIAEIEDSETYSAVVEGVNPVKVERALQIIPQAVRDRIAKFYRKPEPVQMTLEDIESTPTSTPVADIEAIATVSVIQQDEIIRKVDSEIQAKAPFFTPTQDVTTWIRRLNRAQLMGEGIAKAIYELVPQQILDAVWRQLTGGVQKTYIQLFASG